MLTLIGMPGCGKSTYGKKLAEKRNLRFIDVDALIEEREGQPLHRILATKGNEGFLSLEEDVVCSLTDLADTVISPGGSVVYSRRAMEHLSQGLIIYLRASYDTIVRRIPNLDTRGIVGLERGLRSLYDERTPLYEQYADATIDIEGKSDEQIVAALDAFLVRPKVFVKTYGCTLNAADTDLITYLLSNDVAFVQKERHADVLVVNTCAVKKPTQAKIEQYLSHYSHKPLVIAGCLASAFPERLRTRFPHAVLVGSRATVHIKDAVSDALSHRARTYLTCEDKACERHLTFPIVRVPLVEGCTGACTFCITKHARGSLWSYPQSFVLSLIDRAAAHGVAEVQLTGQEVSAYGIDRGSSEFLSLLTTIAERYKDAPFRVRVGMVSVKHLREYAKAFARILSQPPFYRFVHLPVQSGSNRVLSSMRRGYTIEEFRSVVDTIRRVIPDVTISTDIIVGYPTETDEDFAQTLDLIAWLSPDVCNVSKFGRRPHTPAWNLKEQEPSVVRARMKKLLSLLREIRYRRNTSFLGKICAVLMTEPHKGRTEQYRQVVVKHPATVLGQWVFVRIIDTTDTSLVGAFIAHKGDTNAKEKVRTLLKNAPFPLTMHERETADRSVRERLLTLSPLKKARTIAAYMPLENEVNIRPLLETLLRENTRVVLPRIEGNELVFYPFSSENDLVLHRWGIREPLPTTPVPLGHIDVMLVPVVGIDRHGHRIGRGKGFYDRVWAKVKTLSPRPLLIAVAYSFQVHSSLPFTPHDFVADLIVTNNEVIVCDPVSFSLSLLS